MYHKGQTKTRDGRISLQHLERKGLLSENLLYIRCFITIYRENILRKYWIVFFISKNVPPFDVQDTSVIRMCFLAAVEVTNMQDC